MAWHFVDSGATVNGATNTGTSDNNNPDLSGTTNANYAANKNFATTDVNTTTDVITIASHGFLAGCGARVGSTVSIPGGLTAFVWYFLGVPSSSTLTFHYTVADAIAGTNKIDLTSVGAGTMTIVTLSLQIASGSPNLSNVITSHCICDGGGTSHVWTMTGGLHGLVDGENVSFDAAYGSTYPTGMNWYESWFAKVLSPTTFRIYSTQVKALAGGASDINLSTSAKDLTVFRLRGALHLQAAMRLQQATTVVGGDSATRYLYYVAAVDNTNKQIMLERKPTLSGNSTWSIGGRVDAAGLRDVVSTLRAGDSVMQNTDITLSGNLRFRVAGYNEEITGNIGTQWIGKSGARRVLSANLTEMFYEAISGIQGATMHMDNVECQNSHAFGVIWAAGASGLSVRNSRFTDGAAVNASNEWYERFFNCEFSGLTPNGQFLVDVTNQRNSCFIDCYFHDCTSLGFIRHASQSWTFIKGNIFERSAGVAVQSDYAATNGGLVIEGNTFYRNDGGGVKLLCTDAGRTTFDMKNNIFKDNGNGSTKANFDASSPPATMIVERNVFNISGSLGGVNVINYTLHATDLSSDPLFVDPDNATANLRNFGLQSGSPAKGVAWTWMGTNVTTVSYPDLGAVQRQEPAAGPVGRFVSAQRGSPY